MSEGPKAILRIYGCSGASVQHVSEFLNSLEASYNSIYAYDRLLGMERKGWGKEPPFYLRSSLISWKENDFSPRYLIPTDDELRLGTVSLKSPGFWEFAGKLNPLEVLRLYLNDRHERRKDKEYREKEEREKLRLENKLKDSEIFELKIKLLKEIGITDVELAELRNRLIYNPLDQLGRAQERKLIGSAEVQTLEEGTSDSSE